MDRMRQSTLIVGLAATLALCSAVASPSAARAAGLTPSPAAAPQNVVDLQLVLAVDVSRSMDYNEQRVQRDGYVAAFKSAEVQKAISSGPYGRIAVTYIEWSGVFYQRVLVPWRVIGNDEDALLFADELARAPIATDNRTSISAGLSYAASAFTVSGVDSDRRTIDVSGDGANNEGPALPTVKDRVVRQGININGLPILLDPSPTLGPYGPVSLADYYQDCVIGGPGSFVIPIHTLQDFAPAIRRKLILEIAAISPHIVPVLDVPLDRSKVDCGVADSLRQGGGP
jgi:hypothetical protein